MQNSNLTEANLERANLNNANFEGAYLENANLKDVQNLLIDQLKDVKTLYKAQLDDNLFKEIKEKLGIIEFHSEVLFFNIPGLKAHYYIDI